MPFWSHFGAILLSLFNSIFVILHVFLRIKRHSLGVPYGRVFEAILIWFSQFIRVFTYKERFSESSWESCRTDFGAFFYGSACVPNHVANVSKNKRFLLLGTPGCGRFLTDLGSFFQDRFRNQFFWAPARVRKHIENVFKNERFLVLGAPGCLGALLKRFCTISPGPISESVFLGTSLGSKTHWKRIQKWKILGPGRSWLLGGALHIILDPFWEINNGNFAWEVSIFELSRPILEGFWKHFLCKHSACRK